MSEQQVKAGKVDKAEEVLDVIFPSSDEAAEVVVSAGGKIGHRAARERRFAAE
jgi:DNA-binding protein